jgi:hypothetical protein
MRDPEPGYYYQAPPRETAPTSKEKTDDGHHDPDAIEIVNRPMTDNGCHVISIVVDPADAQQTLHGTVTRDGDLVGSYYCADRVGQRDSHSSAPISSPTSP